MPAALTSVAESGARPVDADWMLIRACRAGDSTAFDALYARYIDYVYRLCLGVLSDPEEARDAAQETFIRVYEQLGRFSGRSAFSTWLYRVAVNTAIAAGRRKKARPARPMEEGDWRGLASGEPGPARAAERDDHAGRVREILLKMTPDQRAVLTLRYFLDLSYEEMREVLGFNLGQVKIRLHRARAAFARLWAEEHGPGEPGL